MNARLAACHAVHAVCEQLESLDHALLRFAPANTTGEASKDAAFFQALSYNGVRWYLAYQALIKTKLKKPFKPKDRILYAVLVTAMYQLDQTRQAQHAVVSEAVLCAKALKREWASGLVNAILRGYLRNDGHQQPQAKWLKASFPAWLLAAIKQDWPEHADQIVAASQAQPPMTLRINATKTNRDAYLGLLETKGIKAAITPDSPLGITLDKPVPVFSLPCFDQAWLSVQDESAQLAIDLLDLQAGQTILDACAAPGGKSLHIFEAQAALQKLSVLDFSDRLPRLRDNFKRAGIAESKHFEIIEGDLNEYDDWWDGAHFDRILLDAPCTGTGVIRRHPDIKFRRQAENGIQFAQGQLKLLHSAWHLLQPGGKLLYTTCSIMPIENDDNITRFLAQTAQAQAQTQARALALPAKLGIKTVHGRQRLSGVHSGDGFFYTLLEKSP